MFTRLTKPLIKSSTSLCWSLTVSRWMSQRVASRFENDTIGFIGTGRIAQAIIYGLIKRDIFRPEQIFVTDANEEYLQFLKKEHKFFRKHKINILDSNSEMFTKSDTIMMCVKPKDITTVLTDCAGHIDSKHLILSIAAGVKLKQIEGILHNDEARVIRIMTNTAALVQQSCSTFARGNAASEEDAEYVQNLLESIGTCENEVPEDMMDVITGLSGSGPAYMFTVLDGMAEGGVKMGMTRDMALRMAVQTMFGSAQMVIQEMKKNGVNAKHIMQMKEEVTSPGGTTAHGLAELEEKGVRSAFIKCVVAATRQAQAMSARVNH